MRKICASMIGGAIAAMIAVGFAKPVSATQVVVDVANFMPQATAGQAICTDYNTQCVHGYPNQYGEAEFYYVQGGAPIVVDYVARSYGGGANGGSYIGVSRSWDTANGIRCFSDPGQLCTAPPSTSSMPEGIPRSLFLNVVFQSDDDAASDPVYGTPVSQIAGSIDVTGLTYFQVNTMDPTTCAQTMQGLVPVDVFAAYLYQYPFGGDVGTQDALVVEEVEYQDYNGHLEPNHIERYYYVNNYGRVRDSTAVYNHDTGVYYSVDSQGNAVGSNPVRHNVQSVDGLPPEPLNSCPQGTKPFTE